MKTETETTRDNFRVEANEPVRVRVVNTSEIPSIVELIQTRGKNSNIWSENTTESEILQRLENMERKINLMMKMLVDDRVLNNEKKFKYGLLTDISGSGLSFSLPEDSLVNNGDDVEIRLDLPGFTEQPTVIHGRVVWVGEQNEQKQNVFGVNYINIAEKDRENIISYVFKCQRMEIQRQKYETDK